MLNLICVSRASCKGGFQAYIANVPSVRKCTSFHNDEIEFIGLHSGIMFSIRFTLEC